MVSLMFTSVAQRNIGVCEKSFIDKILAIIKIIADPVTSDIFNNQSYYVKESGHQTIRLRVAPNAVSKNSLIQFRKCLFRERRKLKTK